MEPYGAPWLKSVATARNGKEGVGGSSPEEGSAKAPAKHDFLCPIDLQVVERGAVEALLLSPQVDIARRKPVLGRFGTGPGRTGLVDELTGGCGTEQTDDVSQVA